MSMIAPRSRGGRWVIVPDSHSAAHARAFARRTRKRQNRILLGLVLVAVATGAWAVVAGGATLPLHVAVDLVTLSYGVVILEVRRRRAERRRKVRSLARHPLSASRHGWSEMDRESVAL